MASRPYHLLRITVAICLLFLSSLFLSDLLLRRVEQPNLINLKADIQSPDLANSHRVTAQSHHLAVIIPFRDRFAELRILLPHLEGFLTQQQVAHTFYVINQVDQYRFNRGALLNVGVIESARAEIDCPTVNVAVAENGLPKQIFRRQCFPPTDYLALHDVDLLPLDPMLNYSYPVNGGPHHLIPAHFHPRYYWYKNYFGGVILISRARFASVNGFSNLFWGWGREDDEFRLRMKRANFSISVPNAVTSGKGAFRFIHNEDAYPRDVINYHRSDIPKIFRHLPGGLDTVIYSVQSRQLLTIYNISALMINTRLGCTSSPAICNQSAPHMSVASESSTSKS